MGTPYGTCGHTHYEGSPPCIHTAYQRGFEDGQQRQILAERESAVWAFKEMTAAGVKVRADNLTPTNWHPEAAPGELDDLYSGVKPTIAVQREAARELVREAQDAGLYDLPAE